MSRYSRSPPRTVNTRPQFIGECPLSQNDKTYIQSILQKLFKPISNNDERENYQREISQQLCKHFKQSVGVNVVEGDESYLTRVNVTAKKEPTGMLTFNKLLVRIWVKEDDIVPETTHFRQQK